MQRIVTAAEMRAMDAMAIDDQGIAGYELMTHAGTGVAERLQDVLAPEDGAFVLVLCGKGNNGGDGLVAANVLRENELTVIVVLVGAHPEQLTGDAAQAYSDWNGAGGETRAVLSADDWDDLQPLLDETDIIIDALLGTGSTGAPRGIVGLVVGDLEDVSAPIVAVDMPSGIDADTGQAEGDYVTADLTVTFALPKRGHLLFPGRAATGRLETVDIGIPDEVLDQGTGLRLERIDTVDMVLRLPRRYPDMHKGDRGRLLVVGGSPGLTGAVTLAADAAVRAGAGLVTAGVPRSLLDILELKLTEPMGLALPELEASRVLHRNAFDTIALFQPERLTALALGPGAGRHSSTVALFRRLVQELEVPVIIDADAIHAFADDADLLRLAVSPVPPILTPHLGEFCALTGEKPKAVLADRFDAASRWAARLGVVLVLKGAPTVIADPTGDVVYVNPTGSEALATGGTGDVLTGLISGYLAQGADPLDAAIAGVFVHGLTADFISEQWGTSLGLRARDLIEAYPQTLGDLFG